MTTIETMLRRVCLLTDLEAEQPRCYRIENIDIFVVKTVKDAEMKVYALQNRCGHAGAALHRGEFTDGLIVCPLHGAGYRVATGEVEWPAIIPPPMATYRQSENPRLRIFGELLESIETLPILTYPTTIQDGVVYVTLTPNC